MPADQLIIIQRTSMILGAGATAVAGLVWGPSGMLATGVGAALAVTNFWVIRRLGARAVAKVASGESVPQALFLVAALIGKMALLFALVWLMIRRVGLPVLPFTVGLSVFVFSILVSGLFMGGGRSKLPPSSALSTASSPTQSSADSSADRG